MARLSKLNLIRPEKRAGFVLFLMTFPFIAGTFMFIYYPLFGWLYAFFNYKPGQALSDLQYVGAKWFSISFDNQMFRQQVFNSLKNTLGINLLYMGAMVLPMFFAMFLMELRSMRYRKLVQTFTTIPNFISWVLVYAAFYALLSTNGMLNNLQLMFGLIDQPYNYLASSQHLWLKMLLYHEWKTLGWGAIMYISAITSIDQELYEAADIDGAGRFGKMFYVTLPHLLPTFFVLLVLQIGNMLNNGMDQYLVFSNPMTKEKLEVLDLYLYSTGLKDGQISYSTAMGMSKSIIGLIMLGVGNGLSKLVRGESIF